jgi:uncharacterized protein
VLSIEQVRQYYSEVDAVHDFEHVLRVNQMAGRLGREEGADPEIVQAAALLHDSRGTMPGSESRVEHHLASAAFAAEVLAGEGWPEDRIAQVQHAIRTHRYRGGSEKPSTIEAQVVFDADKLDVLGAIGVARAIAYATLDGQPFYAEPSEQFLQTGRENPGEPHSAYHEYHFKLSKIKERLFTKTAVAIAQERTEYLAGYFARLGRELAGEC